MNPQSNVFFGLLPLLLVSIVLGLVCYFLAKEKGRNAALYLVLGIIPGVNWVSAFYLVGAPDLVLHAKIDRLLSGVAPREPHVEPPGGL